MKAKALFPKKRMVTMTLLLLIAILPIHAAQRTLQEMTSIAYSAFNLDESTADPFAVPPLAVFCKSSDVLDASLFTNSEEAFYIFTLTNNAPGYVIVSADTRLPEILAYSPSSHFDSGRLPESMLAYLQGFVEKMKNTPKNFVARRRAPGKFFANAATSTSVEPLLGNIAFDQRTPYNNACPVSGGYRCVTGCVATAMAQLMKYHQYPDKMKGSYISYTTPSGIAVTWNPSTTSFDWTKIRDTYTAYVPDYTASETVVSTSLMTFTGTAFDTDNDIIIQNLANASGGPLTCTVQFILTNTSGKFLRPVPETYVTKELSQYTYFPALSLRPALPLNISDGNYRLYIGIQKNGTSQWSYAKQKNNGSLQEYYLPVKKTGNYFTIEGSDYHYPCGYNEAEGAEVAKLLAACGASVQMNYGTESSGASSTAAAGALITNFSYDPSIEELSPSYFQTDEWHARIQKELQAHRPLLVSGRADNNNGHAFIIDGYRFDGSTPYYHINWGWSGSDNAYFLIDNMRPSEAGTGGYTDNYSYSYTLFFGIQPDNNIDEGFALGSTYSVDKSTYSFDSRIITFTIDQLKILSCASFVGTINAYACSGNRCYELGNIVTTSTSNPLLPNFIYGMTRSFTIPSSVPTGSYRIILKAQQTGSSVEKEVYATDIPVVQINGNYILGDVDMSGNVDISDVVKMVNYILGSDSSANVLKYGDMDGSGTIDISDVVALVNLILGN